MPLPNLCSQRAVGAAQLGPGMAIWPILGAGALLQPQGQELAIRAVKMTKPRSRKQHQPRTLVQLSYDYQGVFRMCFIISDCAAKHFSCKGTHMAKGPVGAKFGTKGLLNHWTSVMHFVSRKLHAAPKRRQTVKRSVTPYLVQNQAVFD